MDPLNEINSAQFNAPLTTGIAPEMDKQAFLQLLITQMRFQDPLSPMQNEEFVSQLAQFSSLESMNNIYDAVATTNLLQQSAHNAMSTSLIGKYTLTAGNTVEVDGESVSPAVYVLSEAGDVEVRVVNSAGETVRTLHRVDLAQGEHLFEWDGEDDSGDAVPDGHYTVEVEYLSGGGTGATAGVFKVGKINAVRFVGGSPILMIDGDEYRLSDILEVMENLPEE